MAATLQDNNLRRVRMTAGGKWTLLSEKDQAKAIHICDYCTMRTSCVATLRVAQITAEFEVNAVITECPTYRPSLSFRDAAGMDAEFNTVRIGKAWHDRVAVGSLVTLWATKDESEIGTARVTAKFVGRYCDLAADHAHRNHTQIGKPLDGATERLLKVLVGSYGSTFMKPERAVSVIYLERVHDGP